MSRRGSWSLGRELTQRVSSAPSPVPPLEIRPEGMQRIRVSRCPCDVRAFAHPSDSISCRKEETTRSA